MFQQVKYEIPDGKGEKVMKSLRVFLLFLCSCIMAQAALALNAQFPFYIYQDATSPLNHGSPSGWLGDFRDLVVDLNSRKSPRSGDSCIEINYSAEGSKFAYWAGIMWQNPANNAGYIDGGVDLTGARKLTFWARGEKGGEVIDAFKLGGTLGAYPDTDQAGIYQIVLSKEWTQYEIDLSGLDLSYISGVFCWVANRYSNPVGFKFYLDEIKIDKE
jgi:hypothetical protein